MSGNHHVLRQIWQEESLSKSSGLTHNMYTHTRLLLHCHMAASGFRARGPAVQPLCWMSGASCKQLSYNRNHCSCWRFIIYDILVTGWRINNTVILSPAGCAVLMTMLFLLFQKVFKFTGTCCGVWQVSAVISWASVVDCVYVKYTVIQMRLSMGCYP